MAGASSDGEMNYWPGFVDALANLVLALVFVVVIFTLAMVVISSKVTKQIAAKAQEAIQAEKSAAGATPDQSEASPPPAPAAPAPSLLDEIAQLKQELKVRDAQLKAKIKVEAQQPVPLKTQEVTVNGPEIIFTYEPGASDLGEKPLAEFERLLKSAEPLASKKVTLVAIQGSGPHSAEKRAAYYRMVVIRNLLVEKGISPENIQTKTSTEALMPGPQGQVRLSIGSP